ncbi:MAG: hypothetical protein LBM93_03545, partial [Oscillospiraceae bacterium]|nr:hypothetical protein [Oscillospiraceae bacterium]
MKNIKTVEIIYDVFAEKSVITIDRMPLQKFSKILKYQNLPFPEWFPNIFDAIREEINEEYEINFSCFEYEQEVFSFYANQKNIPVKLKSYELDDSIILRLKKFNILCMGGLSIDRIPDISIPIFTDKFSDLLYDIKLPKLSFCKISFDIKPMSELSKFKQFKIIITDENSVYDNSVVINIGKNLGFQGNNRYCCDKDNFNNLILKILNGRFFTDIFKNLIQENFKNNLYYNSFIPLFKISPIINIDIPKNIGMNEKKSLTVTTIPDNSKKPELLLNISPDNILTWENEKLIGLNAGECFVEVYNKENNQLSAKEKVRVYERNPVRKISFKQKEITISQDVFVQLEIN